MVNATQSINSGTIKVTYNASRLKAITIDCGSDFSTPIAPSIANGSASISCARFSSFTGQGHFATVKFQAIASGSAPLGFGVSTIVANDGQGTNVYTGGGSATVTVQAEPSTPPPPPTNQPQDSNPAPTQSPVVNQSQPTGTAAPIISSSSHPDQDKWYKGRKVDISWTKTATEFNYAIDQTPNTQLPQQVRDAASTLTQTVSGDGAWYAHVRAKGGQGWSNTAHYTLHIDASAPTAPTISTTPSSPMKVLPTISFSADDSVSGLDYYEIKLDEGKWQRVNSPYKPPQITSGDHTVTVRAVDKAGNSAESQAKFTIVPLAAPTINSINQGLIMLGEKFAIAGSAPINTNVEIYINGQKKETVATNKNGRFTSQEEYLLFPGTYKIAVKAVNSDGITSPLSKAKTITIDAKAVSVMGLVLPGWSVFGLGGLVIVVLLLGLLWLAYRLWIQARAWAGKLGAASQHLGSDISQLENELAAAVDASLGSKDPQAAAVIKADIAKRIDKVEEEVEADLKRAGSMDIVVSARSRQPGLKGLPHSLAQLPALVGTWLSRQTSKLKNLFRHKAKITPAKAAAENNSEPKPEAASSQAVSAEAERTLAELERKATAKPSSGHSAIPEMGDILTPEQD